MSAAANSTLQSEMPGSQRGRQILQSEGWKWVESSKEPLTVTFIHIEDDSYNSRTHPSLPFSFGKACFSSEGHQLLPSFPPPLPYTLNSHTPPLSHVSESSGPRFSQALRC